MHRDSDLQSQAFSDCTSWTMLPPESADGLCVWLTPLCMVPCHSGLCLPGQSEGRNPYFRWGIHWAFFTIYLLGQDSDKMMAGRYVLYLL